MNFDLVNYQTKKKKIRGDVVLGRGQLGVCVCVWGGGGWFSLNYPNFMHVILIRHQYQHTRNLSMPHVS